MCLQRPPYKYASIEANLVETKTYCLSHCFVPFVFTCIKCLLSSQKILYKYTETEVNLVKNPNYCFPHSFFQPILKSVVIQYNVLMYVREDSFVLIHPHFDQSEMGPSLVWNQHKGRNLQSRCPICM